MILGAGFGGLELATRLSETSADAVSVTLIDRNDAFFFGFSKLEVMLGRQSAEEIMLPYRDFVKDGVEFRQETVTAVDPAARRVTTDAGSYDADFLVVALGADYDFAATPGFEEGGHEYYTLAGAERLRDALAGFKGGKVLVSVLGQPFKCPPAPFEGSFMLDEHFKQQGIRDAVEMTTTFPMSASGARDRRGLADVPRRARRRGVTELSEHLVTGIDPASGTAQLASGETLPYDLFVGIPIHRAPGGARGLRAGGEQLGAGGPDQPQNAVRGRLRARRRLQRPAQRAQGRDLRRGGRACRRRGHRRRHRRLRAARAIRGLGRLLRRVRRRARQQGRSQLPARRRARGPTPGPLTAVRRREGASSERCGGHAGSGAPERPLYRWLGWTLRMSGTGGGRRRW